MYQKNAFKVQGRQGNAGAQVQVLNLNWHSVNLHLFFNLVEKCIVYYSFVNGNCMTNHPLIKPLLHSMVFHRGQHGVGRAHLHEIAPRQYSFLH